MHSIDQTFAALSDATRLAILERLAASELSLSDLATPLPMSQTAVSKHVQVLSNVGLVKVEKRGRTRYCQLQTEPLQEAQDWLSSYQRFWMNNMSRLQTQLEEDE